MISHEKNYPTELEILSSFTNYFTQNMYFLKQILCSYSKLLGAKIYQDT